MRSLHQQRKNQFCNGAPSGFFQMAFYQKGQAIFILEEMFCVFYIGNYQVCSFLHELSPVTPAGHSVIT